MLLVCPFCSAECTIDEQSVETKTCSNCGKQLSTRSDTPASQRVVAESPRSDDETRVWPSPHNASGAELNVLPAKVGRYLVKSLIATGGFAKVYSAIDEEMDRPVALKIPRIEKFKSQAKLLAFLAEARIAGKLCHRGIVTIYDVGTFPDGTNYIAMEHIDGDSLALWLEHGPIPTSNAVDLMIKVADAVHYAHGQGIVHRDLKPGNILIDDRGEPRVVDFGLAVHEDTQEGLRGEVAGTPAYMSPEQYRGEVHRLDGRSDIWSLGVILYQLLTRRRPFNGDRTQLYDEVLHKAPKPPRQIDDTIPRELESICLKCLSKTVSDRYTTAKDLSDDLKTWLNSQAISSEADLPTKRQLPHAQSPTQPTHRFHKFHWSNLGTALLAFAALSVSVYAVVVLPLRPTKDSPDIPVNTVRSELSASNNDRGQREVRARTDAESPPLNPFEEEWRRSLGTLPEEIIWPGWKRKQSFRFNANSRMLEVTSQGISLFRFGKLDEATTKSIEVTFEEYHDPSMVGLFFGYRDTKIGDDELPSATMQVLMEQDDLLVGGQIVPRFHRNHIVIDHQTANMARGLRFVEQLEQDRRGDTSLRLKIDKGKIKSITWRGQPLTSLVTEVISESFPAADLVGGWGLIVRDGTVWCHMPIVR